MAKARAQRIGECGYCGERKPLTQEHVPPKSFYGDVKPPNLPTILACNDCNNGSSADDEYFRDTMVKYHLVGDNPAAAGIRAKLMRSISKPEKRKYHLKQFEQFGFVDVRLPSGQILPKQPTFKVDLDRLRSAAARYVRGLHRFEFGTSIVDASRVTVRMTPEETNAKYKQWIAMFDGAELRIVQHGVFFHKFGSVPEAPNESVWLLVFYGGFPVVAFIDPPK